MPLKKDSNQFGDDPFVKHEPCPECGSSDALARYTSGSAHCFSCNHHIQANGNVAQYSAPTQLRRPLEQMTGTISPIQDRRISQETAKKFNVTVEQNADGSIKKHSYPYYNASSEMVATKVRVVDGKQFFGTGSMKDAQLFGQNTCRGKGKFITITEGELDCLAVYHPSKSQRCTIAQPSF